MGSGNERGPGNELGNGEGARRAEQFPHLENYALTPERRGRREEGKEKDRKREGGGRKGREWEGRKVETPSATIPVYAPVLSITAMISTMSTTTYSLN